MIDELHVVNLALISDATIEMAEGLTVLTGETGAGKSALLSAIKLLVGERASGDQVRDGAESLSVEGRVFTASDAADYPDGHVACRRVSREGRSRVTLDGSMATVAQLAEVVGSTVDLCGQHDHQKLLAPANHLPLLDAWAAAEVAPAARAYAEAWEERSRAAAELERVLAARGESASRVEDPRFDIARIEEVDPLTEATYPIEDASRELRFYRDGIEFDPQAHEGAHERMDALAGLMRAFGPRMQDVFARLDESRELVALVDDSADVERRTRGVLDAAEGRLVEAARALSQARRQAAPRFARQVSEQMGRLEMGGAELLVDVAELPRAQWSRRGADKVEFLYRPGAGLAPRPFAKIASGGEVSRVMLSIKVALGSHDDVDTLIFDEIDTGVGGSTARAVAAVLSDLARTHQVVVVTHLAQLAVCAERHYVVSKAASEADGRPETRLVAVEGEERVREIARMLSGDDDPSSLEHARTLLREASERRAGEGAPEPLGA